MILRDERERRVSDLSPAAVDDERVPAVGHFDDLGDSHIALLALERRVRDRPRDRVVFFAGDDQQRSAHRVLGVDFGLRPRVQVGGRGLEERHARRRHGKGLIEVLGLLLAHRVRKAEAELLEGEWDRTVAVGRLAEHGPRRLQCGEGQRKHALKRSRIDRHGCRRETATGRESARADRRRSGL
jgi:hypothetical protein